MKSMEQKTKIVSKRRTRIYLKGSVQGLERPYGGQSEHDGGRLA